MTKVIRIQDICIGGNSPLALIAGPCVIENKEVVFKTARILKEITTKLGISLIFKSSYYKARTSINTFQGPGLEKGLKILGEVKDEFHIPITADVHDTSEIKRASEVLDIIQIPSLLSRETQLILAAAETGKVINVKKGQFLEPENIKFIIEKIESVGNTNILLTERGTIFGYYNIISDFRSLPIMREFGYPVIYDASHSIRVMGHQSFETSGATPQFIPHLVRASIAVGCDGLFIETHPDVSNALCDSVSMWPLQNLETILFQAKEIYELVRNKLQIY